MAMPFFLRKARQNPSTEAAESQKLKSSSTPRITKTTGQAKDTREAPKRQLARHSEDTELDSSNPRKKSRTSHHDRGGEPALIPAVNNEKAPTPSTQMTEKGDKRTLRSQDGGARFKSDLAVYFPGLTEELLGDNHREAGK
jgi:hypothetical protein